MGEPGVSLAISAADESLALEEENDDSRATSDPESPLTPESDRAANASRSTLPRENTELWFARVDSTKHDRENCIVHGSLSSIGRGLDSVAIFRTVRRVASNVSVLYTR